jgi:hypothetical protein
VSSQLTKVLDFHPIEVCEFRLWTRTELKTKCGKCGSENGEKKNLIFGKHAVGEKFEMLLCGKEKDIEEYKVKACDVDVWYV